MFGALLKARCVTKLSLGYDCGGSVRDDPKLPNDHGEVPIYEWNGRRFDPHCEIFSLLDGKITTVIHKSYGPP